MECFSHFGKSEFWTDYYKSTMGETYDWFQDYKGCKDILNLTFDDDADKNQYQILDAGCGTSMLLHNLYLDGFNNLAGIDNSEKAISTVEVRDKSISEYVKCNVIRSPYGLEKYFVFRRYLYPCNRQGAFRLLFGILTRVAMTRFAILESTSRKLTVSSDRVATTFTLATRSQAAVSHF
jgi:hypothetical protein